METHSSILACRIPWTEEPGGPWGCKELDMTEQQFLFSMQQFLFSMHKRINFKMLGSWAIVTKLVRSWQLHDSK